MLKEIEATSRELRKEFGNLRKTACNAILARLLVNRTDCEKNDCEDEGFELGDDQYMSVDLEIGVSDVPCRYRVCSVFADDREQVYVGLCADEFDCYTDEPIETLPLDDILEILEYMEDVDFGNIE